MNIKHWFLPHPQTHKKAHLISWQGLLIYFLLFILLQTSFSIVSYTYPGVLGINATIDSTKIIELVNIERQKQGLSPVTENKALDEAARMKGANMFEENYWAHFAPSGKSPWDFILGSGYRFTYAGENLAKNFYTSEETVAAWMASPTHRENIMNPKYREMGLAVLEGDLQGQKTTLVVQMFGSTENTAIAEVPTVRVASQEIPIQEEEYNSAPAMMLATPSAIVGQRSPESGVSGLFSPMKTSVLDPYQTMKYMGYTMLSFMAFLLLLDLYILRRRGVIRLHSHHMAHMALMGVAAASIFTTHGGSVL